MFENFSFKTGREGECEFKKSLAEINNSFKVIGSEMKLVDFQFGKNDKSAECFGENFPTLKVGDRLYLSDAILHTCAVNEKVLK